jgi:hypothetical protein
MDVLPAQQIVNVIIQKMFALLVQVIAQPHLPQHQIQIMTNLKPKNNI